MPLDYYQLRKIIKEEAAKSTPFGSGMERAELDSDQKNIVGHTWLTHGRVRSESLREALQIEGNPIGKITHHDLEADGTINYYNIKIGTQVFKYIPARLIESTQKKKHEHEERD